MAEKEPKAAAPPQKKSKSILFIIAGAVIVVLVAGVLLAVLMMQDRAPAAKEDSQPQNEQKAATGTLGPVVMLDSFIVNLAGGKNFLKVEIGLELENAAMQKEISNKVPQIRDTVLMLLSNKGFEEVQSSQGKLLLKNEILMRLNSFLSTGIIKHVYFTSFVVQ